MVLLDYKKGKIPYILGILGTLEHFRHSFIYGYTCPFKMSKIDNQLCLKLNY